MDVLHESATITPNKPWCAQGPESSHGLVTQSTAIAVGRVTLELNSREPVTAFTVMALGLETLEQ